MLRHPVVDFIDLAHASAPVRPDSEGESEGVEGFAAAQPFAFEEGGEKLARHRLRFPCEGEGSEGIAPAQASGLEGEARLRFPWEKVAPSRNHAEDSEGEGVEGKAPSHTSQGIVHGRITHGIDGMVVSVRYFINPIAFFVALKLLQDELGEGERAAFRINNDLP